jgi:hypothetical protein
MIRCIVFDFDGTLVDSNAVKRDCFDRAIAGLGELRARKALTAALRVGGDRYTIFGVLALLRQWRAPGTATSRLPVDFRGAAQTRHSALRQFSDATCRSPSVAARSRNARLLRGRPRHPGRQGAKPARGDADTEVAPAPDRHDR